MQASSSDFMTDCHSSMWLEKLIAQNILAVGGFSGLVQPLLIRYCNFVIGDIGVRSAATIEIGMDFIIRDLSAGPDVSPT
jgi:hypothetical protein